MKKIIFIITLCFCFNACKKQEMKVSHKSDHNATIFTPKYALGFTFEKHANYTLLTLKKPYPNAQKAPQYLLLKKGAEIPENVTYDALVRTPVDKIVVSSTTHIPALENLGVLDKLIGFPNTQYISSKKARALIDTGKIKELGANENINTEILIDLQPDVVIGFGVNGSSKSFSNIQKAGIPVIYNGEWMEEHALGRAEWINFFGILFDKEKEANQIFETIETAYIEAQQLAKKAKIQPTVLSGSMFKDTWHVPNGKSWNAKFIADANANYLWKETSGTGSIALNLESILDKAKHANFWVTPASFQDKASLLATNKHYEQFDVFQQNNIYVSNKMGATGGLIFYEKGPSRPDLILKDLIKIFHPELLPDYDLYFYQKLN